MSFVVSASSLQVLETILYYHGFTLLKGDGVSDHEDLRVVVHKFVIAISISICVTLLMDAMAFRTCLFDFL